MGQFFIVQGRLELQGVKLQLYQDYEVIFLGMICLSFIKEQLIFQFAIILVMLLRPLSQQFIFSTTLSFIKYYYHSDYFKL